MSGSRLLGQELPAADEPFLKRWSRRKLDTETEDDTACLAEIDQAQEAQLPCDEDMPQLDALTEDSDYSGFLSPNVSESLRRLALRKLFHSPVFNVCDGLDDYDDDFRSFTTLGDLVTAEMRRRANDAAEKLETEAKEALAGTPESGDRMEDRLVPAEIEEEDAYETEDEVG